MIVVQQMRIKSVLVALFVFDIVGQLVEGTNENVSILQDTHRQMTSRRLKMDCLLANAGEMADRNQPGETPTRSPVAPHSKTQCGHKGVGELVMSHYAARSMGGESPWNVSVLSKTPLFQSVHGVPLPTGPPHHDKVTGPRV